MPTDRQAAPPIGAASRSTAPSPLPDRDRIEVTAVICTYTDERWARLVAAVDSLRTQSHPPLEILVVIDHNPALARRASTDLTGVRVLESTGPRGLSGGRNTALAAARAPFVAFLDDDATADRHWLAGLVAHLHEPSVAGVGGRVTPAWPRRRPRWFPAEFDWVIGCTYAGMPESVATVRNPFGGAMVLRRDCLRGTGHYRTDLGRVGKHPLGCEETELCIRVRRHRPGTVFLYEPAAEIHHHIPDERCTWGYFRRRCYAEGLSKAVVRRFAGAGDALASERDYLRRTLPRGLLRGLGEIFHGDVSGVARSVGILIGLVWTAAGFAVGAVTVGRRTRPSSVPQPDGPPGHAAPRPDTGFVPTWITAVDLDAAAHDLVAPPTGDGGRHRRASALVLLHRQPIGVVEVDLDDGTASAAAVGDAIRAQLGEAIAEHLLDDGLAPRIRWSDVRRGPTPEGRPPCWAPERTATLPPATVVLCTRDRPAQAVEAIEGLLDLDYPDLEVVVVDNAPTTTATADAVEERFGGDPRVRYVLEPVAGLARARNTGVAHARGEIVAFTDDDIRVERWWLRAMARGFERSPGVVCVTGAVVSATCDTPAEARFDRAVAAEAKWGFRPRLFDLGGHRPPSPLFPYQAGIFGGGGNSAFLTEHLRSTGGFDPALGAGTPTAGGEDLDAFLRVLTSGGGLAYEPAALVWHHHATDERAVRRQTFRYGVGLGAYLGKVALSREHVVPVLVRAPRAVHYLLSGSSDKNAQKGPDHPRALTVLELAGVAWGPVAYLRSRRRNRS